MMRTPILDRLLCMVDTAGPAVNRQLGPCWLWRGHKIPKGYGRVSDKQNTVRAAHRVLYELMVGPIGEGLHLDHLCRRKDCVRPAHMEPVTPAENNRRSQALQAWYQTQRDLTHCPSGHPYDEANTYLHRRANGRGWNRTCRECGRLRTQRRRAAARQ